MSQITTVHFNDQPIHVLSHQGKRCFLATEVGEALGYSDPKRLTDNFNRRWNDEAQEGVDFFKVEGEDLDKLRSAVANLATANNSAVASLIHYNTRSLLLLTRDGVNLSCIKAQTEQGAAFRRWLASEVLPALQDSGSYSLTDENAQLLKDPRAAALHIKTLDSLRREGLIDPLTYGAEIIEAAEMNQGHRLPRLRKAYRRALEQRVKDGMIKEANADQLNLLDRAA